MKTKTLDLGCGRTPKNFWGADEVWGIDILSDPKNKNVKVADLVVEPIPFNDDTFDYITAHDFLEHVPRILYVAGSGSLVRIQPFINLMNEIFRALKQGGKFLSFTPAYPQKEAFTDPTHVNVITEETFPLYFCKEHLWASSYGFNGQFVLELQQWQGPHLISILSKPY